MQNIKWLFILSLSFITVFSSCDKDDETVVESKKEDTTSVNISVDTIAINKWIYETMELYYLWNDKLPAYSKTDEDPNEYFYSLLYSDDRWSYMTDDYSALTNRLNGVEVSSGYSLALYLKEENSTDVIGVVTYVYNNSPAEKAGIGRGDIFMAINGDTLNLDNYYELLFETDNQEITLGAVFSSDQGNYVDTTGEVVNVMAEEIEENPIVHYEIMEEGGSKIGYLVYTDFIESYCAPSYDDDGHLADVYLSDVFTTFKEAGVEDVILDLRYNLGGAMAAAKYLATSLAPESVTDETVLVNYVWNDDLTAYWKSEREYSQLEVKFLGKNNVVNLGLDRIVILTTGSSASASEVTIVGLDPYMDVITVGETTHGKYTGSTVIPDDEEKWALMPIILKYSNAEGVTDFGDGLTPTIEIAEGGVLYPFGDMRDPILAAGVNALTGESKSVLRSAAVDLEMEKIGVLPTSEFKKNGLLHFELENIVNN